MRKHYNFSNMKACRNPYVKLLKQSVTIRLDRDTVEYFKALAVKTGVPYQHLINLYLRDCAVRQKELAMRWAVNGRRTTRCTRRSASQPASER